MVNKEGTHLISDKGYLDSVRYLGLTTIDAINELIDNSFDADADHIYLHVLEDKKKISIIVEDDGIGISQDKIDEALSFGGRVLNAPKNRVLTGKFGWGLSSAACCQTTRTEIYSKVKGKDYYYTYLDLNELKKLETPLIFRAKKQNPHFNELKLTNTPSGTIIIFKDCDNLDRNTVNGLVSLLVNNIGEVNRKYLIGGKKIVINEVEVKLVDPLMLTPGCMYSDELGLAEEYANEPLVIHDIIDPNTNKHAIINIRVALLNIKKIRENPNWKGLTRKMGINPENQGFYLMRHNRQIAAAQTLGLFVRHPSLNYFRGEISFPPCLDHFFGIQTNKSRFSLNNSIKDKLQEKLKGVLEQLKNDADKIKTKLDQVEKEGDIRPSEKIIAKVDKLLKSNKYDPTIEEIKNAEEELENKKDEIIIKIKKDKNLTEEQKEVKIRKIENNFQFRRPFRLVLDYIESGHFYIIRPKGKDTEVVINTAHQFYKKVYERAIEKGLDIYLDLLLFTFAKAELEYYDKEEVRKFYNMQRGEWSAILTVFLDECFEMEEVE